MTSSTKLCPRYAILPCDAMQHAISLSSISLAVGVLNEQPQQTWLTAGLCMSVSVGLSVWYKPC